MAFNITSDGSPTPRKGPTRFNMPPGDLRVDTSPEVLAQINGNSQNYYPIGLHPSFGSSLTSSLQGLKRPLGDSTMGNVAMPSMQQQQQHFGGFKVSDTPFPLPSSSSLFPSLYLALEQQTDSRTRSKAIILRALQSWTHSCNDSMSDPLLMTPTSPHPAAPFPSRRLPRTTQAHHLPWQTLPFLLMRRS
jgi:hypothetical protein